MNMVATIWRSLSSTLDHFCSHTSMHGFAHISSEPQRLRIFWTCVILITSCCAVIHLYLIFQTYFQYDYYESVKNIALEYFEIS